MRTCLTCGASLVDAPLRHRGSRFGEMGDERRIPRLVIVGITSAALAVVSAVGAVVADRFWAVPTRCDQSMTERHALNAYKSALDDAGRRTAGVRHFLCVDVDREDDAELVLATFEKDLRRGPADQPAPRTWRALERTANGWRQLGDAVDAQFPIAGLATSPAPFGGGIVEWTTADADDLAASQKDESAYGYRRIQWNARAGSWETHALHVRCGQRVREDLLEENPDNAEDYEPRGACVDVDHDGAIDLLARTNDAGGGPSGPKRSNLGLFRSGESSVAFVQVSSNQWIWLDPSADGTPPVVSVSPTPPWARHVRRRHGDATRSYQWNGSAFKLLERTPTRIACPVAKGAYATVSDRSACADAAAIVAARSAIDKQVFTRMDAPRLDVAPGRVAECVTSYVDRTKQNSRGFRCEIRPERGAAPPSFAWITFHSPGADR